MTNSGSRRKKPRKSSLLHRLKHWQVGAFHRQACAGLRASVCTLLGIIGGRSDKFTLVCKRGNRCAVGGGRCWTATEGPLLLWKRFFGCCTRAQHSFQHRVPSSRDPTHFRALAQAQPHTEWSGETPIHAMSGTTRVPPQNARARTHSRALCWLLCGAGGIGRSRLINGAQPQPG